MTRRRSAEGLAVAAFCLALCLSLSSCAPVKRKASEYYVKKAAGIMEMSRVSASDVERAFAWLEKAISLDPSSVAAVKSVEELSAAASRNGYPRASEMEVKLLSGLVGSSPLQWHAYPPLIQALALRGEVDSLAALSSSLAKREKDLSGRDRHHALMALCVARASLLPWLESDGFLNLSRNPARVRERTMEYVSQAGLLAAARAELGGLEKKDPSLRSAAQQELASVFEVSMADAFSRPEEIERLRTIAALFASNPSYGKAAGLTVKGNSLLLAREYGAARAMYTSALKTYPAMLDARRQLVEVDFQEGAGLAVGGSRMKHTARLLYRAYEDSDELIEAALESGPALPFVSRQRFAGDLYALKAAVISAVFAIEGRKLRNKVKLETEFKASLDEAVRLAPDSRLARELLERYSKKVFKPLFAAALLPLCAGLCRAQEAAGVDRSTSPVRSDGSLTLNVVTNDYGSRMGVDYSLRWDFSDLAGINPFSARSYRRLNPFSGWDIFENTRWRFYGLSVNPWRVIVSRGKPDISGAAAAAKGGNGKRARGRRVWKLSLSPLLYDLQEHLDEDLRRALLDAALDPVSEDWHAVPRAGKKAFMRDVLSLDVWALPLMGQPRNGIKYIAE